MKKLKDVPFSERMAKEKGYEYFKNNIHDLVKRGKIGERVDGKIIGPSDADIRAKFQQITGKSVDVKPEKTDKS